MRGLLQLARVSQPPRTLVAHHEFPSTSCFYASSETPNSTEHEYMQMNGLIMRLTRSCFKPSVIMVYLQLNYTVFDV